MPAVTKAQLAFLKPFLEGGGPNEVGEQGMHCPFHNDSTRSASLNLAKGLWFCNVCSDGGGVKQLVNRIRADRESTGGEPGPDPDGSDEVAYDEEESEAARELVITEDQVDDWHERLLASPRIQKAFTDLRGITLQTVRRFQIGYDDRRKSFTIPVRDASGKLVNLRWYNPNPKPGRRKIWGVPGHNSPRLYPIEVLDGAREIVITEGEWDALITIQSGFDAITRTAAAGVWKSQWNVLFDDKIVYICQDMDEAGQEGAAKIMRELSGHAREVRIIELPYDLAEKHGEDLTDFFHRDGAEPEEFEELIDRAAAAVGPEDVTTKEFVDVSVIDSYSADRAGERMSMNVTIVGKTNPPFLLPEEVQFTCSQDAGAKCNICPMNELGGSARRTIQSHDPLILEMMHSTKKQVTGLLREVIGAQPCNVLEIEIARQRSVEQLFVRPSVDVHRYTGEDGDYTSRKIISVGKHDSLPNNTVLVTGTIYPNPRGQHNEFQAWTVEKTETSIDVFDLTPSEVKALRKFKGNGDPLAKIMDIADDLAEHVTKIYGRPEMHALMDLVYHSVIGFEFAGQMQVKGWVEALILGDTRTGKSEAAERLRQHYEAGEMVSCESASFAGIVGGLQQMGAGKEWEITWGAIPINDRRMVTLDEVSGLTTDQIAQMSSIRSSGEAQLTKIRSERTLARTRLLWMGNPRNGRMNMYTYGVQGILPLIGNNEDVARFDIAMTVKQDEVSPEDINRQREDPGPPRYDREAAATLLRWVWSRTPDQVEFTPEAEEAIYEHSIDLGSRYIEIPPLIQSANVRIKVARVAAAIAARTFSTDETHTNVIVDEEHVHAAVEFFDRLYRMPGFGYYDVSKEAIEDAKEAVKNYDEAKKFLYNNPGLAKFLRGMNGLFRSGDLQDMMNMSRDEANSVINVFYKFRMIKREGPNIKINPTLHQLLREVKD